MTFPKLSVSLPEIDKGGYIKFLENMGSEVKMEDEFFGQEDCDIRDVLSKFKDVFTEDITKLTRTKMFKHGIELPNPSPNSRSN